MARAVFNNGGMDYGGAGGSYLLQDNQARFQHFHLRIPPAFWKHILNELSVRETLTLNSHADSSWNVRAHRIGRNIYLKEGWQEFLRDNSFGDSEFLVFGYDGNMRFSIDIFEKNGCKRTEAPAIIRHQQSTFTSNTKRPRGRPRKRGNPGLYTFILENTERDRWEVSANPSNNQVVLCGGWIDFARVNGVEIGDVCLFELESKSKMVVHIIKQSN